MCDCHLAIPLSIGDVEYLAWRIGDDSNVHKYVLVQVDESSDQTTEPVQHPRESEAGSMRESLQSGQQQCILAAALHAKVIPG